uniref:Uncharacterized protein n=1 Tax=Arundo donax TaxID=35708 RepID=A0A0A9AUX2_ARUDO
MDIVWCEDRV